MDRRLILSLLSCASACTDDAAEPAAPPSAEIADTLPSAAPADAEAPAEVVRPHPGDLALRPRPYRARTDEALALNAKCVSCHEDEARAWRGSHHQRAYDNPAFRKSLTIEPTAFCRGCHAAEAVPNEAPSAAVGALGVACVTCHVVEDGSVLAAARVDEHVMPPDDAPHAIRYSTDFATTGACASCHEFAFPGPNSPDDGRFMQTTIREHARSPNADRACSSCHMPIENGKRSHTFSSVRDPAWLKAQIDASARISDQGALTITVVQTKPGHAFPTGDLFRRLQVGAEIRGPRGEVRERRVRYLARHFEVRSGGRGRELIRDDRVFYEPLEVELGLSCDAVPDGASLKWWVTYQRVAQTGDGSKPEDAEVESEVPLHTGKLCEKIGVP